MEKSSKFLLLAFLVLISGNSALSQVPTDIEVVQHHRKTRVEVTDQDNNLPKNGILSTSQSGYGNVTMGGAWGDQGVTSGSSSPISGSVSKKSWNEWVMKVFNTSQDDYRVTVRVLQYSESGKQVSAPSFTLTLKAGQSVERNVRTSSVVKNCSLEMRNWKNLSEEKRKQEELNDTVEGVADEE